MSQAQLTPETLDALQRQTFDYFVHEVNPLNGLIADRAMEGSPASIAATGLALAAYPIGVERVPSPVADADPRRMATLRFSAAAPTEEPKWMRRATRAFITTSWT